MKGYKSLKARNYGSVEEGKGLWRDGKRGEEGDGMEVSDDVVRDLRWDGGLVWKSGLRWGNFVRLS